MKKDDVLEAFRDSLVSDCDDGFAGMLARRAALESQRQVRLGWGAASKYLRLCTGELVGVIGFRSHGKSIFLLQMMCDMLIENMEMTCIYVTYQHYLPLVKARFLNVASLQMDGRKAIVSDPSSDDPLRPLEKCEKADSFCLEVSRKERCGFLEDLSHPRLESVIDSMRNRFPLRKIVLFVDDIDGLESRSSESGTYDERMWKVTQALRGYAREKQVLIITSYTTESRVMSEPTYDLHTASSATLEVLNRSCSQFEQEEEYKKLYMPRVGRGSICQINVLKNRNGPTYGEGELFLFDGDYFHHGAGLPVLPVGVKLW